MKPQTRTQKSVVNARAALFFYVALLAVEFWFRKVFLDYLGSELLGLNSTMQSILQFVNLAELGIGAAVAFTLYSPLARGNRQEIADIVSLQGYFYKKVAIAALIVSAVLVCFFPLIFAKAKADVVSWYPYAAFAVMLAGVLTSYVFNYRQVVLNADQKGYLVLVPMQTVKIAKTMLQIGLIAAFPEWGYIAWLVVELAAVPITVWALNRNIDREYPWLKTDTTRGRELARRYPVVLTKTKQLFFHKSAGFALSFTTIPILYAYASLTAVAVYTNYLVVTKGLTQLVSSAFNSITAGIGNLVAGGDGERILRVFEEYFTARYFLGATACFGVWMLADPFVTLWVGAEYLLDRVSLGVVVATLFIGLTRGAVESFLAAYGLFEDTWAPIVEGVLNVGLSILLGWFFGLPGILGGVFISLIVIVFCWKPLLLFRKGFGFPVRRYVAMYALHLVVLAAVWAAAVMAMRFVDIDPARSWGAFVGYTAAVTAGFAVSMGGALWLTTKGMRDFVKRIINIVNHG